MTNSNLITGITCAIAGYYVYVSYNNLYALMNPLNGVEFAPGEPTIDPLWVDGDQFNLFTFLSTSRKQERINISRHREQGLFLLEKKGFIITFIFSVGLNIVLCFL